MIDLTPRPIETYTLCFVHEGESVSLTNCSFNALFAIAYKMLPSAQAVVKNQNGEVIYPAPEPVQVVKLYTPELPGVVLIEALKNVA